MKAVLRYLGGRLHRKLFVGFGATIIVTFMMVGLAMHLFSIAVPTPWDAELARLVRFTGHRFAETWHDPAARERLARSMAQDLMITVSVSDVHGERLGTYGPPCAGYELDAPVERICGAEVPMPYAQHLEQAALPQAETVVATVKRMVNGHG